MHHSIKPFYKLSVFLVVCCFFSCKKFIEIPASAGQLVSASLFATDATASSAVVGMYSRMVYSNGFASGNITSIPMLTGLSSDELINYSVDPATIEFYTNSLKPNNSLVQSSLWSEPYQFIYTANACIEGITASEGITPTVKNELLGECSFVRAFCYFYLVNLFGEVPLVTQSAYTANASLARANVRTVNDQIVQDLEDASSLLPDDYSAGGGERIRPNQAAAQALLARVFLYQGLWTKADQTASAVLNQTGIFSLEPNLDSVFVNRSREAIWQLKPVQPGYNSNEANIFILTDQPVIVSLSAEMVAAFENNDLRKMHWVGAFDFSGTTYYYPNKYKIPYQVSAPAPTEYPVVLRLAEQYLIRAEARYQSGDADGALADLNSIRLRAGLPALTVTHNLLADILQERRVELFTEWGHRWLDLKRTQTIDSVMAAASIYKGSVWNTNQQLYPIPQADRQADPNLTQNTGY